MNEAKKTALLIILCGLLLLLTLTSADVVSTNNCWPGWSSVRVRDYPADEYATEMTLRACKLTALNPDVANLPNLYSLDVSQNYIAEINLTIFKNFPKLQRLYLDMNNLRTLDKFPDGSCGNLTELNLSFNELTYIQGGTFSACSKLRSIDLNSNLLTHIHPDAFSSLTELINLNLYENQLTFITTRMFISNIKLKELSLDMNRLSFLPANFATTLRLAPNAENVLEFIDVLKNPWECGCLLEFLTDVKKADVRHVNEIHASTWVDRDGQHPACVFVKAAPCDRRPPSGFHPAPGAISD